MLPVRPVSGRGSQPSQAPAWPAYSRLPDAQIVGGEGGQARDRLPEGAFVIWVSLGLNEFAARRRIGEWAINAISVSMCAFADCRGVWRIDGHQAGSSGGTKRNVQILDNFQDL